MYVSIVVIELMLLIAAIVNVSTNRMVSRNSRRFLSLIM